MDTQAWRESQWEAALESMLANARPLLQPQWAHGEIIVLKTASGRIHTVAIPDYQDPAVREPLENRCIQTLLETNDTAVSLCLATVNGLHPEIPSWNFRKGLVQINAKNLETETFLWGGGNVFHVKQFKALLPPNYKI